MGGSAGSTGLPGKFAFLTKSSFPAASSTKGQEPGPVVQQQLWVLAAALGQKGPLPAARGGNMTVPWTTGACGYWD